MCEGSQLYCSAFCSETRSAPLPATGTKEEGAACVAERTWGQAPRARGVLRHPGWQWLQVAACCGADNLRCRQQFCRALLPRDRCSMYRTSVMSRTVYTRRYRQQPPCLRQMSSSPRMASWHLLSDGARYACARTTRVPTLLLQCCLRVHHHDRQRLVVDVGSPVQVDGVQPMVTLEVSSKAKLRQRQQYLQELHLGVHDVG